MSVSVIMTRKKNHWLKSTWSLFACWWMLDAMFLYLIITKAKKKKLSKVSQSYVRTLGSPASSVFRKHWYLGSCLLFLCQALACCHHLLSSFLVWQCMRSCSKAASFNKGFPGTQLAGAIIIIICSCCTMGRSCLCQGKARQKWRSKINEEAWCED